MRSKPINNLDDAIDATLAFYGITKKQAALQRAEIDLKDVPASMEILYNRVGGILDESIAAGEYGPFRAGCFDLEYPFIDQELGLMVMSDCQNGPMFRISGDKTKIECVGLGSEEFWSMPIDKFLTTWLVDDWQYRLRWELNFPDDNDGNVLAFERLRPKMTKIFTPKEIMTGRKFYVLNDDVLVIHTSWGVENKHVRCTFGAFHKPKSSPPGAFLEKSQWHDETHAKWEEAMKARR